MMSGKYPIMPPVTARSDSTNRSSTPRSNAGEPAGCNVVVAARVRPLDSNEVASGAKGVVRMSGKSTFITDPATGQDKPFTFDHSFWSATSGPEGAPEYATQENVYCAVGKTMLSHAFQGFNTCIFAYGQTGAGKTYTMMGDPHDPGIIPRACEELFARVHGLTTPEVSFKVELSYFEIYNERVRCLLNAKARDLRVREHPVTGPFLEGLTRYNVRDFDEVARLLEIGNQSRTVASTRINQQSSRSHAVVTLVLTQTRIEPDGRCTDLVSKINLVDLAGSERCGANAAAAAATPVVPGTPTSAMVSDEQFKEGVNINKSLSTLGRVIHALADSDQANDDDAALSSRRRARQWVAYRDSVLTWLLKENLGGNSKTCMLALISPASTNYEESLTTLRYADRVKYIKNEAVVNEDQNAKLIRELREEINFLRRKLHGTSLDEEGRIRRLPESPSQNQIDEDKETLLESKLEMTDQIIAELNQSWEERMQHTHQMYKERISRILDQHTKRGFTLPDLPCLINLDPHLGPGEALCYPLKPGETYLGTDDESHTPEEAVDEIRLPDGFNLSNPHCILEHHDNGEIELVPLNGSLSYVNGHLLTTTHILTHGSRVSFGSNHLFLFIDPAQGHVYKEQRKEKGGGSGIPRVMDWAYASHEFADAMNLLCKPQQFNAMKHELEQVHEHREELARRVELFRREILTLRHTPFVVLLAPGGGRTSARPHGSNSNHVWYLRTGKTCIGPGGDVAPSGVRQTIVLDWSPLAGAVHLVTLQHGVVSGLVPLHSGHRFVSGECEFQLVIPVLAGAEDYPPTDPACEDVYFTEDLRHKLYDLQFVILHLRDQLFPPPPEPAEGEEEDLEDDLDDSTSEEKELHRRRQHLTDDSIISKPAGPAEIVHHLTFLQHELRDVAFHFAQRIPAPLAAHKEWADGAPPPGTHVHTSSRHDDVEKDHLIERLQREVGTLQGHVGELQLQLMNSAKRWVDMDMDNWAEMDPEARKSRPRPWETTGRPSAAEHEKKMLLLQAELDIQREAAMAQERDCERLRQEIRDKDTMIARLEGQIGQSGAMAEQDRARLSQMEDLLADSRSHLGERERQIRDLSSRLQQQQEIIDRQSAASSVASTPSRPTTNDYLSRTPLSELRTPVGNDHLVTPTKSGQQARQNEVRARLDNVNAYHNQLMESYANVLRRRDASGREELVNGAGHSNYGHSLLGGTEQEERVLQRSPTPVLESDLEEEIKLLGSLKGSDTQRGLQKSRETIKLLTKLMKTKDEKIARFEKDLASRSDQVTDLTQKLEFQESQLRRLGELVDHKATEGQLIVPEDRIDVHRIAQQRNEMDVAMQALKAEAISVNRLSLPVLDKIVTCVQRLGAVEAFRLALETVHKALLALVPEHAPESDVQRAILAADVDTIVPDMRPTLLRSLREMVIAYDMARDYIKGGLITHTEIVDVLPAYLRLARLCSATVSEDQIDPAHRVATARSGSSKRSVTPRSSTPRSVSRSVTPTPAPVATITAVPSSGRQSSNYSAVQSRIAAYISPKRGSTTTAVPGQAPSSGRPSGHSISSGTTPSVPRRAVSPRPTNVSRTAAAAGNSNLRKGSPDPVQRFGTPTHGGQVRSNSRPKVVTPKGSSSPVVAEMRRLTQSPTPPPGTNGTGDSAHSSSHQQPSRSGAGPAGPPAHSRIIGSGMLRYVTSNHSSTAAAGAPAAPVPTMTHMTPPARSAQQ